MTQDEERLNMAADAAFEELFPFNESASDFRLKLMSISRRVFRQGFRLGHLHCIEERLKQQIDEAGDENEVV